MQGKPYIIGITGGSASGKTHFLRKLEKEFGKDLCIISQDDYYKPIENQPLDSNGVENFDTPDSIDLESFAKDIKKIISGEEVLRKEYTFNNPSLNPKTIIYKPAPVIIAEGIFILHHPAIYSILDLSIFLDVPENLKLKRRIVRDQTERGYDLNDVLYRYENHVSPTFENYIKPFKNKADIIIPNTKEFSRAIEVLTGFLKNKIADLS